MIEPIVAGNVTPSTKFTGIVGAADHAVAIFDVPAVPPSTVLSGETGLVCVPTAAAMPSEYSDAVALPITILSSVNLTAFVALVRSPQHAVFVAEPAAVLVLS